MNFQVQEVAGGGGLKMDASVRQVIQQFYLVIIKSIHCY